MFETILFPVDRSRETTHAIGIVADLSRKYDSAVVVLSVIDSDSASDADVADLRQSNQALLEQVESALQQAGVFDLRRELRDGKVAFAICDAADDLEAGLIVMGCRGLGLADDEIDSVSNRVINLAPCPVLVIP